MIFIDDITKITIDSFLLYYCRAAISREKRTSRLNPRPLIMGDISKHKTRVTSEYISNSI